MRDRMIASAEVVLMILIGVGIALIVAAFAPVLAAVGAGVVVAAAGLLVFTIAAQIPAGRHPAPDSAGGS